MPATLDSLQDQIAFLTVHTLEGDPKGIYPNDPNSVLNCCQQLIKGTIGDDPNGVLEILFRIAATVTAMGAKIDALSTNVAAIQAQARAGDSLASALG